MKRFTKPVLWEFRSLLQGEGRTVEEALLSALLKKAEDLQSSRGSKFLIEAIERNEVTRISELDGAVLKSFDDYWECIKCGFRFLGYDYKCPKCGHQHEKRGPLGN